MCPATPDSLLIDDKENSPTGLACNINQKQQKSLETLKGTLAEPRGRNPLSTKDLNRPLQTPTPLDQLKSAKTKSASEPAIAKHIDTLSLASAKVLDKKKSDENNLKQNKSIKRPLESIDSTNQRAVKCKQLPNWEYKNDLEATLQIITKLGISCPKCMDIETPIKLFEWLESNGELSGQVLGLFASCPGIVSLRMGPTYGGKVNEVGLLESGKHPAIGCTVPLFSGFAHLQAIDLTCVAIEDDDLRYLIRQKNLLALGLSGTKVSNRGIKYLGKHATFSKTLQCLKLCYLDRVDGGIISELSAFSSLSDLDLYGSDKINPTSILQLVPTTESTFNLKKLRLPEKCLSFLRDMHVAYTEVARRHSNLILDTKGISELSLDEVKIQLRLHQKHYSSIFLNLDIEDVRLKLIEIVTRRRKEEILWSICQ